MTIEELRQYILGILDNSIGIRDEQRLMANTAKRVGGNLGDITEVLRILFCDYLNQPVKTDSDVIHKSVTAKSFTEEDNPGNENVASTRLVETDGGYLGDMSNVEDEANTAMKGSVLIKDQDKWIPVYPTYSGVSNHDNLLMPVFNTLTKQWLYIPVPSGNVAPVLNSISINSGAPTTYDQEVSLSLNVTGSISRYKVSESSDLSTVAWVEGTSQTISFNLSSVFGLKTIHVRVQNSFGESEVKSSSITLVERPSSTYTVTARSNDVSLGSVSPATQEVEENDGVIVTATAKDGNVIDSWGGVDSGTGVGTTSGEGRILNVRENRSVTCNFRHGI